MDTSDYFDAGIHHAEYAPQAIHALEERADEMRAAGDRVCALGLDTFANELRNWLSDDWGKPGDAPISVEISSRALPDGMVDIAVKLGPAPRRTAGRQVS